MMNTARIPGSLDHSDVRAQYVILFLEAAYQSNWHPPLWELDAERTYRLSGPR
jgi:hypothetical protein